MSFQNTSLSSEFLVIFIVDTPHFDEPVLRSCQEMVIIKLENVSDSSLMPLKIRYFLSLHVKITDFSVGLSKQYFIRVLLSRIDKCRNTISCVISLVNFLGDKIDFCPNIESSSPSCGKHQRVQTLQFLNVLVLLVYLLRINEKSALFLPKHTKH